MNIENKRILAIIPARGGSKGFPRKNIVNLFQKPLISWTITSSLKSKYITKTIVSSDDDEILAISKKHGSDIIKRPLKLATDESPTEPVIKHVLEALELNDEKFDYIVLLQPTSPLRDEKDIDDSIEKLLKSNATALISVYEPEHTPFKAFKENEDGYLAGLINNEYPFMRRQDLPKVYMPNGAIYIAKVDEFFKNHRLFTDKTIHYLMSKEKSIDIDTSIDLQKAESILKNKG